MEVGSWNMATESEAFGYDSGHAIESEAFGYDSGHASLTF